MHRPTVIITGGSSGIGLATAKICATRGYDVAIVGRSADKLAAAAVELNALATASGQRILTRSADLSVFEQASEAIDSLVADGFGPDILVNSAGVIVPGESVPTSSSTQQESSCLGSSRRCHSRASSPT